MDKPEALCLEGVTKTFGDFVAVKDLSLSVRAGKIFGLIGPNGAGKTTTMRMIVNITMPDSGRIEFLGQPVGIALQDRVGYLPEERGLYKKMKVRDQLRFFGELKRFRGRAANETIDRWLEKLKLTDWKNKKAIELSKGMQQKVQFIAAVMHDPELIVLDEPFSGLDPVSVELLKDAVLELKAARKTIVLSTHQMEMAERLCDDVCLLNHSQKVLGGSLREIKRGYGRNSVALRLEGSDGVLDDRTLVARVERSSDEVEAVLADGANPQDLLRALIASGAAIQKFELVEPSLNEIFIQAVGGNK
jgi:ABC-2 type transport system ATP-binding protein